MVIGMRYKDEEQFSKDFKQRGAAGLYLLYGGENYLIEGWKKRILAAFGGEEGFNLQRLEGKKLDVDELYDATQMIPLFADKKCVFVEDMESGKGGSDLEKLEQVFQELPEECVLLITARSPGFDPGSAGGKKLAALADKYGAAVALEGRDKNGLIRFLQSQAKKNGCVLSPPLARRMLELCGNDMHTLASETAKLCAYAGEGQTAPRDIAPEHLEAVVIPRTEARVFDLGKAILAGNSQRAMEILRDLFYLREEPVAIGATLIMSYTDLYRVRVAKNEGVQAEEVVARFGYKGREFRVRNAFGARISTGALRKSLGILLDCERSMKGSRVDSKLALERAVLELICVRGE